MLAFLFLSRRPADTAAPRWRGTGHRRSTSNAVMVTVIVRGVFVPTAKEQARRLTVVRFGRRGTVN